MSEFTDNTDGTENYTRHPLEIVCDTIIAVCDLVVRCTVKSVRIIGSVCKSLFTRGYKYTRLSTTNDDNDHYGSGGSSSIHGGGAYNMQESFITRLTPLSSSASTIMHNDNYEKRGLLTSSNYYDDYDNDEFIESD